MKTESQSSFIRLSKGLVCTTLLGLLSVLSTSSLAAQSKFLPYRGVAYTVSGNKLVSSAVAVQLSVLKSEPTSEAIYTETHKTTTDGAGQFQIELGKGLVKKGKLQEIVWTSGDYFLEVGLDVNGGESFRTLGVMPFFFTPPAAEMDSTKGNFLFSIGETYGGGVVFHQWKDAKGVEHGLVVSLYHLEFSPNIDTKPSAPKKANPTANWTGLNPPKADQATPEKLSPAGKLCDELESGGFDDWYLPSVEELAILWKNSEQVNVALAKIKESHPLLMTGFYWSRTKHEGEDEWTFSFSNGNASGNRFHLNTYLLRAIRAY
jgi:hypothetical protein